MVKFEDLKVEDRFYCVRNTKVTVYKIYSISDHGSYLTISGSDIESLLPDCDVNISKDLLDTYRMEGVVHTHTYFSDWRAVRDMLNDIIRDYAVIIRDINDDIGRFMLIVDETKQ